MSEAVATVARGARAGVRSVVRHWRAAFGAVFVVTLLLFWIFEPPATFAVSAETEFLEFTLGVEPVQWYLRDATLRTSGQSEPLRIADGSVEFRGGAMIVVERIGRGATMIGCRRDSGSGAAVIVYDKAHRYVADFDRATIRMDTTLSGPVPTAAFGLSGAITVGNRIRSIAVADVPLLKQGRIRVFGQTLSAGALFDAGSADLEQGDFIDLNVKDGPGIGLLVIDERPGVQVLAKTVAASQMVNTFQGGGYTVNASVLSRLQHDPVVQSFWVGAGTLWGLLTSLSKRKRS